MVNITLDDYLDINNKRLLDIGIDNPSFTIIKGVVDDVYKKVKKGDMITLQTSSGYLLCEIKFKYRDAKDIKIFIKGKTC